MNKSKDFTYPFKVNSIYILESLNDKINDNSYEEKTGKSLYNDLTHYINSKKSAIRNLHYIDLRNNREFYHSLQEIKNRIIRNKIFPLIHIEMHGNEEGVRLSPSNTYVKWLELGLMLRSINIECKNNLIVSLGVCKGESIIKALDINQPATFFIAIGTSLKISANKVYQNFYNLYSNILNGATFKEALEKSIYIDDEFRIFASELFFQNFEDKVLNDISSVKKKRKLKKRLRKFVNEKNLNVPQNFNSKLNLQYSKENELSIISDLVKTRNKFLMIDVFPENKDRFPKLEDKLKN